MEIIVYLCVMRRKEERSLQKMCVRWFRLTQKEALIFAVPNGGSRNKLEAYQMKLEGVLAGVSDLLVIFRDKVLFIELKTTNVSNKPQVSVFQNRWNLEVLCRFYGVYYNS